MTKCKHDKHKISRTHGSKSRGTPICKDCKKVIPHEHFKQIKVDEDRRRKQRRFY